MKTYIVYMNDQAVGVCKATKLDAKKWIKTNVLSTHMGQWCKMGYGLEYATTIGQYYQFVVCKEDRK